MASNSERGEKGKRVNLKGSSKLKSDFFSTVAALTVDKSPEFISPFVSRTVWKSRELGCSLLTCRGAIAEYHSESFDSCDDIVIGPVTPQRHIPT